MSPRSGITGRGYVEFEIDVEEFTEEMIRTVKRIIAETAEMIVSQAKALAPVDEGNLKTSINSHYYNDGLLAEVIVGAEYAVYVEYGTGIYAKDGKGRKTPWVYFSEKLDRYVYTHGHDPQPFWEPSVARAAVYFKREMNTMK